MSNIFRSNKSPEASVASRLQPGVLHLPMNMLKIALKNQIALAARKVMGTVTHFAVSDPVVALTFDDGPHPVYTPRLLGILGKFGVCATFFMIGKAAERHPELVQRIAHAGHAIGNHSWDHTSFTAITGKERRDQIRACKRAISPYGQRIFRPPWGNHSLASSLDSFYLRYEVMGWNLDVGDWWDQDSRRMSGLLTSRVRPGSVILLHDSVFCKPCANQKTSFTVDSGRIPNVNREPMLLSLNSFLGRHAKSFHFATIPEMFRLGKPIRRKYSQM